MSLCLSMIVKNEAHVIQRCLRSVKPFIDSYSISDTGSTDNTMEIIREELAGIPGVLESDPWQDFSTNRNISLSRCTGDYVLIIDADEVLVHLSGSLQLDPEYDGFYFQSIYPDRSFWLIRIIRNDSRWKWEYKIHEALTFDGTQRSRRIENFIVQAHFDSHRNQLGDKFERDLKIFESEPPTPRNVFYHARTLAALNRNEEAIQKFYQRAKMGGWEEEVYFSLWKAADLMGPERPFSEIAGALYRAYRERPTRFEALAKLCKLLNDRKEYDESYRLSLVEPKTSEDILFVDHRAEWNILIEHARASHHLGKLDESHEYFTRVEEIASKMALPQNFLNLSLVYYQIQRYSDCIAAAKEALKLRPDYAEAFNNVAVSYNALGEWDLAINAANEALRINPDYQLAKNNLAATKAEKAKHLSSLEAPRFSADWFGSNIENWTQELSHYKGKPSLRFLEIGCFEGRATRWMLDNILTDKSSTIEVIDTFEGSPENQEGEFAHVCDLSFLRSTFERNIQPFSGRVEIHQGYSHDVLQKIAPNRQEYFDFIYIDGSHHQDDVYRDAEMSWPLLKNGGILAFDDYEFSWLDPKTGETEAPKIGIDQFLSEHNNEFILLHKGWQLHIRKSFEFASAK